MKIRVGGCIIFGAFEAPDCFFFLSFLLSYCCWLHGWGWHSLALTFVFSSSIRYDTRLCFTVYDSFLASL